MKAATRACTRPRGTRPAAGRRSAATVTVTGDDGNPLAINTSAPTPIRQLDVDVRGDLRRRRSGVPQDHRPRADGAAASAGSSCHPKSAITNSGRYADYRGNGNYAVVVQTFTNSACTAGARRRASSTRSTRAPRSTPPTGRLTRSKNSFSTINHQFGVALNPGGLSYEVKYARGGVLAPDGSISGPSSDAFVDRNTGLADTRFTEPGGYAMVARIKSGDDDTPWSAPVNFTVKAPFDLSFSSFLDSQGPKLQDPGHPARSVRARQPRAGLLREGQEGRQVPQARPFLEINSKRRFTVRFKLRRPGVYRLQYRFKGRHWWSAGRSPRPSASAAGFSFG